MKMTFQNILTYFFLNLLFVFTINVSSYESRKSILSAIDTHTQLLRQIDSLDLEKQNKKRAGQDIEQIELEQSVLVDSLKKIKLILQTQNTAYEKNVTPLNSFINPSSTFDWIILFSSAIAFIALVIFILNFVSSAFRKGQKNQHCRDSVSNKKHSQLNKVEKEENSYNLDKELELLEQLRQRVKKDSAEINPTISKSPTRFFSTAPIQLQSNSISYANTSDLEKEIIEAFQNGSDVSDLSRKFHLSSDHISLVLKMNETVIKK